MKNNFICSSWLNVASDASEGLCNSFDTTIAIDEMVNYADTDTDSGVHNNSTPDHLDTLETRTNDSLYESLKYQQGEPGQTVQIINHVLLHTRLLVPVSQPSTQLSIS